MFNRTGDYTVQNRFSKYAKSPYVRRRHVLRRTSLVSCQHSCCPKHNERQFIDPLQHECCSVFKSSFTSCFLNVLKKCSQSISIKSCVCLQIIPVHSKFDTNAHPFFKRSPPSQKCICTSRI